MRQLRLEILPTECGKVPRAYLGDLFKYRCRDLRCVLYRMQQRVNTLHTVYITPRKCIVLPGIWIIASDDLFADSSVECVNMALLENGTTCYAYARLGNATFEQNNMFSRQNDY